MTAPNPDALVGHAVLLVDAKRPEAALRALQDALSINPEHGRALVWLPIVLRRLDRLDDALTAAQAAVRARPESADAYIQLSASLSALNYDEEALAAARKAVECDPQYTQALLVLTLQLLDLRHLETAEMVLEQAIAVNPNDVWTLEARLAVARAREDWKEAEEVGRALLAVNPESAHANRDLGEVLLQRNRTREAMWLLEVAVRSDPTDIWATDILKQAARFHIIWAGVLGLAVAVAGVWLGSVLPHDTPLTYWVLAVLFAVVGVAMVGYALYQRHSISSGGRRFLRHAAVQLWKLRGWTVVLLISSWYLVIELGRWDVDPPAGLERLALLLGAFLGLFFGLRRVRPFRRLRSRKRRATRHGTPNGWATLGWLLLLWVSVRSFQQLCFSSTESYPGIGMHTVLICAGFGAVGSISRLRSLWRDACREVPNPK